MSDTLNARLARLRRMRDATTDADERSDLALIINEIEKQIDDARQVIVDDNAQLGVANQGDIAGSMVAPVAAAPGSTAYAANTIHQHYYSQQTATSTQAGSLVRVFDITLTGKEDNYTVQAVAAWAVGEVASQPFRLPLDHTSLLAHQRDAAEWVTNARIVMRRPGEELRKARELGQYLFQELFTGTILTAFRVSRSRLQSGEYLRVRLRLTPTLANLPWELLHDPEEDLPLALDPNLSLVRYLDLPQPMGPLQVEGSFNLLVVAASPRSDEYEPLDVDRELHRLRRALAAPLAAGQITLEVIQGPDTRSQLRERLRVGVRDAVHILHVISHGEFDEGRDAAVLIFENQEGEPEPTSAAFLAACLKSHVGSTRLVVLNACQGTLASRSNPAGSLALPLLKVGIPAVLAMQFDLADQAAANLTRVFYTALAAGVAVDVALSEARLELRESHPRRLDWVVPVLFLRSDDGVLFIPSNNTVSLTRIKEEPPESAAQAQVPSSSATMIPQLRQQGLIAYYSNDWERAERLLSHVVAVRSTDNDAAQFLATSRRWLSLKERYAAAIELRKTEMWETVLNILNSVAAEEADYPDPEGLWAWVEAEQRRTEEYQAALNLAERGEWNEVITRMQQLLVEFPHNVQARDLFNEAKKRIVATVWLRFQTEPIEKVLQFCQTCLEQSINEQVALAVLVELLERPQVLGALRVRAGELLAFYGDPRPGVCDLPPPFVPFAMSQVVLGSTRVEAEAVGRVWESFYIRKGNESIAKSARNWPNNEINEHPTILAAFELARYPVTNAQFRQFIDAEGYQPEAPWWSNDARAWLARDDATTEGAFDWLRRRYKYRPEFWEDPHFGQSRANYPVVGVNWYEATAFCAWLTIHLNDDYSYHLPSEAEWEYAARGTTRRTYPWGMEAPNPVRANADQNYQGTTAVGCFPQGATSEGLLDMAGNVWEWTRSISLPYPYDPNDGREDNTQPTEKRFVLRGGSWNFGTFLLRAAVRHELKPDLRFSGVGFRLARHRKS